MMLSLGGCVDMHYTQGICLACSPCRVCVCLSVCRLSFLALCILVIQLVYIPAFSHRFIYHLSSSPSFLSSVASTDTTQAAITYTHISMYPVIGLLRGNTWT